jgi:hypothetical protein
MGRVGRPHRDALSVIKQSQFFRKTFYENLTIELRIPSEKNLKL